MIPIIKDLEVPLLRLLAQRSPLSLDECTDKLSTQFNLSIKERSELMSDGKRGKMKFNVGWAKANLKREGLVDAVSRGIYTITQEGWLYLQTHPNN